jgi:phage baseplate assembly protein W
VAIKLKTLATIGRELKDKKFTFKDLHLDFEKSSVFNTALGRKIEGNDIKVSFDDNAIKNSLRNLFNTKPGQRFLFPRYGMDLNPFLFEAVTSFNAQALGERIVSTIETFETRVSVIQCDVTPLFDDNSYDILLILGLPLLQTTFAINTTLDLQSQSFINFTSP